MNTEGTGSHTYKKCHKTESPWNHTSTAYKEREQLGDRRSDGDSRCNSGDGTGQMAQPWMFIMMMMNMNTVVCVMLCPAATDPTWFIWLMSNQHLTMASQNNTFWGLLSCSTSMQGHCRGHGHILSHLPIHNHSASQPMLQRLLNK